MISRTSLKSPDFKEVALERTKEALITTDKIPTNLTVIVDSNSTIAISILNTATGKPNMNCDTVSNTKYFRLDWRLRA